MTDRIEEQREINVWVLSHQDFLNLQAERKHRTLIDDVPSPAGVFLGVEETRILGIVIDGSFLPEDMENDFLTLLVEHELAEGKHDTRNPELLRERHEQEKRGEIPDQTGHKLALRHEMRLAAKWGILDKYQQHWRDWYEKAHAEVADPEVLVYSKERATWREEAYHEVRREFGEETSAEINQL
jgi:hypothetical protein